MNCLLFQFLKNIFVNVTQINFAKLSIYYGSNFFFISVFCIFSTQFIVKACHELMINVFNNIARTSNFEFRLIDTHQSFTSNFRISKFSFIINIFCNSESITLSFSKLIFRETFFSRKSCIMRVYFSILLIRLKRVEVWQNAKMYKWKLNTYIFFKKTI